MNQGKFASITSSLLARKGEAAPWHESGRAPLAWRADAAAPPPPAIPRPSLAPSPPAPGVMKRCSVRLSQEDYERLGLMAMKRNCTRQQLLQAAMTETLAGMAREFSRNCACIGQGYDRGCVPDCGDKS